ncbi:unnamed protein product [Sphagnum balticum]
MATKQPEEIKYTESSLYKGKVQIRFYPESHRYYISVDDGKFVQRPGVTTICGIKDKSTPLRIWQQRITADFLFKSLKDKKKLTEDLAIEAIIQCDIKVKDAADIGQEIHAWCEAYIRNKLKQKGFEKVPEIPNFPEAINGVNAFLAWEQEHKVKYHSSERVVYSKSQNFVGTLDVSAEVDGMYCLIDFKSSNGLYNGVRMQTAAYCKADEEEQGKKLYKGRWALRLSKYSEFEYYEVEQEKKMLKKKIAELQGKEFKDYEIKPYQVFEAKFLDGMKEFMDRDWKAFINCRELYAWDAETDPYRNENW